MKTFMALLVTVFAVVFLAWASVRTYYYVNYHIHVEGRLKRAADANTVEIAAKELDYAVKELDRRGWTQGSTNVLWWEPAHDVGFWYENLKTSLEELRKVRPETTQLERSNLLLKLRETLLYGRSRGSPSVTAPPGISVFPANVAYYWWGWGSFILLILTGIGLAVVIHQD